LNHHSSGTNVVVEGPRFSSKAESKMFQLWGGDIINMTAVPEVVLANEAGLCYAAIAMVTDYDCWRDDHDPVSQEQDGLNPVPAFVPKQPKNNLLGQHIPMTTGNDHYSVDTWKLCPSCRSLLNTMKVLFSGCNILSGFSLHG